MRGSARQEKLAAFAEFVRLYDECEVARREGRHQPWTDDLVMNAYDVRPRMADREPPLETVRASLKELGFRQMDFSSFNLFVYATVERLRNITNRDYLETLQLMASYRTYRRLKTGRQKWTRTN